MVPKFALFLFSSFLLALLVVQPSMTTQTENEKLAKLTERLENWQGEMEILKSENKELKADVRKLKSKVENLTKKLQSKHDETSEQNCMSSGKENTISRKKRQNFSTKNAQESCKELRTKGHFANGIYQVDDPTNPKKMEAVSCQFNGAGNTIGDSMGSIDLKTQSVHFSVQRTSEFVAADTAITYENSTFNYGDAMDLQSGAFTAPVPGIYYFAFSGVTKDFLQIIIRVTDELGINVKEVASTTSDIVFANNAFISVSLSTSLHLAEKDKVSMIKNGNGTLSSANLPGVPNTIFSGWLVEEFVTP